MKKTKIGWFEYLAIAIMILSSIFFIYNLLEVFGK